MKSAIAVGLTLLVLVAAAVVFWSSSADLAETASGPPPTTLTTLAPFGTRPSLTTSEWRPSTTETEVSNAPPTLPPATSTTTPTTPPPATSTTTPPALAASQLLDELEGQLEAGRTVFNPPKTMRLFATERVEVRITVEPEGQLPDDELRVGLKGEGQVEIQAIQASRVMKVELEGGAYFDILELSDTEQLVPATGFAQWEFEVTPVRSGEGKLILGITAIVRMQGTDRSRSLPVYEREIQVTVSGSQKFASWWSANWQWVVTSLLALLAIAVPAIRIRSRRVPAGDGSGRIADAGRVFISYRRSDVPAWVGRLHDQLAQQLGPDRVFMDVEDIAPGQDFVEAIRSHIADSVMVIVAIGPSWLAVTDDEGRRRIDTPGDHVATEVELALASRAVTLPVLFEGTAMPSEDELPPPIRDLHSKAAMRLDVETFQDGIARLVRTLREPDGV